MRLDCRFIRVVALPAFLAMAGSVAGLDRAAAHPPSIVNQAAEKALSDEIGAFRKVLAAAIATRDAAKLREMYAPSFTHTHASGKTDDRDARLAAILAGDVGIEGAPADTVAYSVPNDWVVVATGTSRIKLSPGSKTVAVKWVAVFTRTDKSWQIVASQATRADETKR